MMRMEDSSNRSPLKLILLLIVVIVIGFAIWILLRPTPPKPVCGAFGDTSCAPPRTLSGTLTQNGAQLQLALNWDGGCNASTYRLYWNDTPVNGIIPSNPGPGNAQHSLLDLKTISSVINVAGRVVYASVTSVCNGTESAPSAVFSTIRNYTSQANRTALGQDFACPTVDQFGNTSACQVKYTGSQDLALLNSICDQLPQCRGYVINSFNPAIVDPTDPTKTLLGVATFKSGTNSVAQGPVSSSYTWFVPTA